MLSIRGKISFCLMQMVKKRGKKKQILKLHLRKKSKIILLTLETMIIHLKIMKGIQDE